MSAGPPADPGRPTRVLMVEDDPRVAAVNREMVETVPGFWVVGQAATVARGREMARSLAPDLLLVDVYLPDGNGLELVHALRAEGPEFEAIMVTAASDLGSVRRALHDGVLDYLIKPFRRARLREALRRYLEREAAGHRSASLDQAGLDRLLGRAATPSDPLPKGIDPGTLEAVRGALLGAGEPLSAEEVGGRVGLSRVTAWRYLEHLAEVGLAELEVAYGSVGRPTKRYRIVA